MKENILVSETSSPTKNPSENVENNLVGAEVDAQEVGGGGLVLFYMFAVVAFLFATTLRSGIYEYCNRSREIPRSRNNRRRRRRAL